MHTPHPPKPLPKRYPLVSVDDASGAPVGQGLTTYAALRHMFPGYVLSLMCVPLFGVSVMFGGLAAHGVFEIFTGASSISSLMGCAVLTLFATLIGSVAYVGVRGTTEAFLDLRFPAEHRLREDMALAADALPSTPPSTAMIQEAGRLRRRAWGVRFKRAGSVVGMMASSLLLCVGGLYGLLSLLVKSQPGSFASLPMFTWGIVGALVFGVAVFVLSVKSAERLSVQQLVYDTKRTHLVEGKVQPGALQYAQDEAEGGLTMDEGEGHLTMKD